MEHKQDEMTQDKWEEMKKITRENVCADCGAELQIHTVPEEKTLRVGCINREHGGFIERQTYTQLFRRGQADAIHPAVRGRIERRMLPGGYEYGTALALIKTRFPRADLDDPSAALFLMDCIRLDLDPLLGEIFPVTFRSEDRTTGVVRKVVQPIIAEDGWLSLAARACPDRWVGPPKTFPLEDYLRGEEEYRGKTSEEIDKIAKAFKLNMVGDAEAYFWVAFGKVRVEGQIIDTAPAYGWLKQKEYKKASREGHETPAGEMPGNQARVRSIKRWVRENFSEAKSNMKEMTSEWLKRGEGIEEVQQIIEAEYHILTEPPPSKPEPEAVEETSTTAAEEPIFEDENAGEGGMVSETTKGEETRKNRKAPAAFRDPSSIETFGDLYTACFQDWPNEFKERKDIWAELGHSSQMEIADSPADCYRRIKGARG